LKSSFNLVERYTGLAIALHWLMALMLVISFSVGLYMADLPFSMTRLKLFNWHKWAGVTILALALLRLVWRLTHRPPPALPAPAWQQAAAHVTHLALYALFFLVPLVGWAYSSAAGFPIVWFGVLPLPDLLAKDKELGKQLAELHSALNIGLLVLVGVHAAAALMHHLYFKDDILRRMLPARFQTKT